MPETQNQSPLSEADPKSLDELFNEDPLDLTKTDLATLVAALRSNRDKWAKEESEAQAQGRARRPKVYKDKLPKGQISLSNIGLDKGGKLFPEKKS